MAALEMSEYYHYLGMRDRVICFVHRIAQNRGGITGLEASGQLFNALIHEQYYQPGQTLVVFDIETKEGSLQVYPKAAHHTSDPLLAIPAGSLEKLYADLLGAPRSRSLPTLAFEAVYGVGGALDRIVCIDDYPPAVMQALVGALRSRPPATPFEPLQRAASAKPLTRAN